MSGVAVAQTVDCAVHCAVPSPEALYPYLGPHWPGYLRASGFAGPWSASLTYPEWSTAMATTAENSGLASLQAGPLGRAGRAVLHCYYGIESMTHPYLAPEMATAVNRWLADEWLDRDPRLLAAAALTPDFAPAAIAEIERIAADPRFVQIMLPARSREPYGAQRYWPIWEAAAAHGLALAVTFGGAAGAPPTPLNWAGTYFEDYVLMTLNYQTQLNSLVMSGVFVQQPQLRVTMVGSGWTWLSGFMWRMDAEWKQYQRETPWLVEPPSSYVRRHFRFTTQPSDLPPTSAGVRELLDEVGGDTLDGSELLLYASDHPHRSTVGIDDVLDALRPEQVERVMCTNATGWYGLAARPLPALTA